MITYYIELLDVDVHIFQEDLNALTQCGLLYYFVHAIVSMCNKSVIFAIVSVVYSISLSTVVLNSRDRPGNLWLP